MTKSSVQVTYRTICDAAQIERLEIMGGVAVDDSTVILLGPGTGFWAHFKASPEMRDGVPHPVDRWSKRVITDMARSLRGEALFPFGGPPYVPFLRWAMDSRRAWQSPAGMLVHDTSGLMVSYRGALRFMGPVSYTHLTLPTSDLV